MTERPIVMDAESVRAILDERKWQTRRVIKPQPDDRGDIYRGGSDYYAIHITSVEGMKRCRFGQPGDRLWVRETWAAIWPDVFPVPLEECSIEYKADSGATYPGGWPADETSDETPRWRSPMHMPRWASRITLQITYVGVEQLQEIMKADALAEGIDWTPGQRSDPMLDFIAWWDSLNAKRGYPYSANPWVWIIEFTRIEGT